MDNIILFKKSREIGFLNFTTWLFQIFIGKSYFNFAMYLWSVFCILLIDAIDICTHRVWKIKKSKLIPFILKFIKTANSVPWFPTLHASISEVSFILSWLMSSRFVPIQSEKQEKQTIELSYKHLLWFNVELIQNLVFYHCMPQLLLTKYWTFHY